MIYCKNTTLSHPNVIAFPRIINCIDSILLKEGCDIVPTPFHGKDLKGIDGDALKPKICFTFASILTKLSFTTDLT